jgi:AcrR family transcriptional regulator
VQDKPGLTRRERLEQREEAILAAAKAVFAEAGPEGARIAEIAARADVAEGTIYLYFRNKQALIDAVIARFYERLTREAQAGVERLADTFERFEFLARHHMESCMAEWHVLDLMIGLYRKPVDTGQPPYPLNKAYVAVFDRVFREAEARGEVRDGLPLWIARDFFYGTLEYSTRTLMLRGGGARDVPRTVEMIIEMMKRAAAPASPAPAADRLTDLDAVTRRLEAVAARLGPR